MRKTAGSRSRKNRYQVLPGSSGEHLLDVRVRRSTAKRQRQHRVWRLLLGIILWIGLAAGSYLGFQAIVNKFFLRNPEYNLRIVDAELDELMSREEAMKIAGITIGENIFRLDLSIAERELRKIDQIDSVTLQRDWPDRITIKLKKRVPIAWLGQAGDSSADHNLLLDVRGRVIKPYRVESKYWHLPVIYARDLALIQKHDALAMADLQAALDLLTERKNQPDSLLEIQSIDITKGYALEVIDANKAHITFAPQDIAGQLFRLEKLLVNSRDHGRQIESVNMIPKKYTPIRFLLASAPEEGTAVEPTRKESH